MKKVFIPVLLLLMVFVFTSFAPPKKEKIKWITMKELATAYAKQPRPVIIDVYTSWCGWCKVMDKETYGNNNVASYINDNYYAVKFDAESTEPAVLGSKTYAYNPGNGVHELAMYLLYGQMGYPTAVLMSSIDAQPAPIAGYMKPSELEAPLKYFGEGAHKKQDFSAFMKTFTTQW